MLWAPCYPPIPFPGSWFNSFSDPDAPLPILRRHELPIPVHDDHPQRTIIPLHAWRRPDSSTPRGISVRPRPGLLAYFLGPPQCLLSCWSDTAPSPSVVLGHRTRAPVSVCRCTVSYHMVPYRIPAPSANLHTSSPSPSHPLLSCLCASATISARSVPHASIPRYPCILVMFPVGFAWSRVVMSLGSVIPRF